MNIGKDINDVDLNSSELHSVIGQNHVTDAFFLFWCENRPPIVHMSQNVTMNCVDVAHMKSLVTLAGRFVFTHFNIKLSSSLMPMYI